MPAEPGSPGASASSDSKPGQGSGSTAQADALQEQLASALQRVVAAEKEAAAAKEAAGTELALMRRQLTSSQAALADAEQVLPYRAVHISSRQHEVLRHPSLLACVIKHYATATKLCANSGSDIIRSFRCLLVSSHILTCLESHRSTTLAVAHNEGQVQTETSATH